MYEMGVLEGELDDAKKKKLHELKEAKAYAQALPSSVSTWGGKVVVYGRMGSVKCWLTVH